MDDIPQVSQEADLSFNPFDRMPSYLVAANNHNIASQSLSLTDYAAGGVAGGAGAVVGGLLGSLVAPGFGTVVGAGLGGLISGSLATNEGKFAAASLFSGAASFYNTGVEISNWFGADAEKLDVAATLTDYDSDLGAYYRNKKESADLVGFAAASLIPTVGALKVYNVGTAALRTAQAGEIGANFSSATGLLASRQGRYLAEAIKDMGTSDAPMRLLNGNMLKAFATGVAEEAIQGAFVSTAILSTMHASPVLEAMDAKDMAWNITEGAILGGAIGGVLRGAGIFGNVKTGIASLKSEAAPYIYGESLPEGSPLAHKILNGLNNKFNVPEAEGSTEAALVYATRKKSDTFRRIDDDLRVYSREMANKDDALGLIFSDTISTFGSIEKAEQHLLGLQSISRINVASPEELALAQLKKNLTKSEDSLSQADMDILTHRQTSYLKHYGEDAGAVTIDPPPVLGLADRLKKGESIEITPNSLKAGGQEIKLTSSEKVKWDPLEHTQLENEARNQWAMSKNGPTLSDAPVLHDTDLALMKRAYLYYGDVPKQVTLIRADGSESLVVSKDQLFSEIQNTFETLRDRMSAVNAPIKYSDPVLLELFKESKAKILGKANSLTNPEIAQMLDVPVGYLEKTAVNVENPVRNLFEMRTAAEDHTAQMVKAGRYSAQGDVIETFTKPQYSKLVTDTKPLQDVDGNVLKGMAALKERARLQQISLDNATASTVGPSLYSQLPSFSAQDMSKAVAEGGPGTAFFKSANNSYGSLGSMFQQIGAATNRIVKSFVDQTTDAINPAFYALKQSQTASLEWSALQTKLRATPEVYYHDVENSQLVLRRVLKNQETVAAGGKAKLAEVLDPKAPATIPITNPETNNAFAAHVLRNSERVVAGNNIKTAGGYIAKRDPRAAYPLPVNQRDYPHFAFVVDDTVTGTGHVSTLYAATADDLEKLITKVNAMPQKLTVLRKDQTERYRKALGDYVKDDTITESDINTALFRSGASANFVPKTDPLKIVDDAMDWHFGQDRLLARYAITSKYSKEFDELTRLGEGYAGVQTSRVGAKSLASSIETKVKNPFVDYIKTALNLTSTNETPTWTAINNFAETKFTSVYRAVKGVFEDSYTPEQADKVNAVFQSAGLKTAMYDASLMALSNHTAPVGDLTRFVSRANSVLATLQLRMDPTNAFVNTASSVILDMPEIRSVLKDIAKQNPARVGELAQITLPGTGDSLLAPAKLYANATKRFFTDDAAKQWARDNGFMTRHLNEYQSILDDVALKGTESAVELTARSNSMFSKFKSIMSWDKFDRVGNVAERVTGNKLAEEFNRFVAADMMKQITDVAVEQGVMTQNNALSYINTFVNRTQGNYLASQRPLMFQGAVGQAIGLFQNYQFNMMQQVLRHVSEGAGKDAAMIMGMQATVYGMHGLPGFDYINNHIVGTMSGNKDNRDLYDATYGAVGKTAGDWLMYGTASNMFGLISPDLRANLYTRGDINPRQATIVPLDPAKIPIINASIKFFSNMKDTAQKLGAGGDIWPTMLQGIEHSGVNRPLAGLAQVLEAFGNPQMQSYGTSGKGNITVSNDLMSLANLTRLVGAKPMDEAIAIDAAFRLDAYKTVDAKRRENLGQAIKTSVIAGNVPPPEQIESFLNDYVKNGGQQKEFNQFMIKQMKQVNTSHANKIAESLKSPHAISMQRMLDGYELKDFTNTPQY